MRYEIAPTTSIVFAQVTRTSWCGRRTRPLWKVIASNSAARRKLFRTTWPMSGCTKATPCLRPVVRLSTPTEVSSLRRWMSATPAGTRADRPTGSDWRPRPERTSTSPVSLRRHVIRQSRRSPVGFYFLDHRFVTVWRGLGLRICNREVRFLVG